MKTPKSCNEDIFSDENLSRIQIRHLYNLKDFKIFKHPSNPKKFRIFICIKAFDRDKKIESVTATRTDYNCSMIESTEQLMDLVRETCHHLMKHEMDECLYLDDKRIYDPHNNDPPLSKLIKPGVKQ